MKPTPNWDDPDFFWRSGGFSQASAGTPDTPPPPTVLDAEMLKAELAQLRRARWGGTNSITYAANGISRTATYRSDRELAAAITDLENKLADSLGLSAPRAFVVYSSKGW